MTEAAPKDDATTPYRTRTMPRTPPPKPREASLGAVGAPSPSVEPFAAKPAHRSRRLEGARESEILRTAFDLFVQHGYGAVTMDAVAVRAEVSKATLYRRWPSKVALIKEAVLRSEALIEPPEVDTGHLRSDLIESFIGPSAALRRRTMRLLAGCPASIDPDARIAAELGGRLGRSEVQMNKQIYARAQARGEIEPDRDLDLLASLLPGALMHYECASGLTADRELVERITDSMVMPSAGVRALA